MKTVLSLLLTALLFPATAGAGATMALWADTGMSLSPELTTRPGVAFTVVVTLDSDGDDAAAAEFVITDIREAFPGVFATGTKKIYDTPLDLGQNELGEYMMAFTKCAPPNDRIEMVRITYMDFSGVIGSRSAVLTLRGFQVGDTQPSSFNGSPGFIACDGVTMRYAEMGGHANDGALCVNCFEPPANEGTMTELKSKF